MKLLDLIFTLPHIVLGKIAYAIMFIVTYIIAPVIIASALVGVLPWELL